MHDGWCRTVWYGTAEALQQVVVARCGMCRGFGCVGTGAGLATSHLLGRLSYCGGTACTCAGRLSCRPLDGAWGGGVRSSRPQLDGRRGLTKQLN